MECNQLNAGERFSGTSHTGRKNKILISSHIPNIESEHNYAKNLNVTCVNILSLNVNGFYSKFEKGVLEEYMLNFDIVCLTETKTETLEDDLIPGYSCFVLERKKAHHRYGGYHGICIFVKSSLSKHVEVIQNTIAENVLWIRVKNQITGTGSDTQFLLGCIYIPPEGSVYYDENCFDIIIQDIIELQCKYRGPFIMVGDFNARTGLLDDFLDIDERVAELSGLNKEDELFNSRAKMEDLGLTTGRYSLDRQVNNTGRKLIEFCRSLDLKMVNGRFGCDKGVGNFTCHKNVGESLVDYVLMSPQLMPRVNNFLVDDLDKLMSDVHSPLCVSLEFNTVNQRQKASPQSKKSVQKAAATFHPKWIPEKTREFANAVSHRAVFELDSKLDAMLGLPSSQEEIDNVVGSLCNIFIESAKTSGQGKEKIVYNEYKTRPNTHKPWFNASCKNKRKEYFKTKRQVQTHRTPENDYILRTKTKEYKKHLKDSKGNYYKDIHRNLRNVKFKNPKKYWDILNKYSGKTQEECKIDVKTFKHHFKQLSEATPVADQNADTPVFDPKNLDKCLNEEINTIFTFNEIMRLVKKLKNNKTCGTDLIINEFIKHCPGQVIECIVTLFNVVLNTGIVPTDWCIGVIQPIYKKKGSPDDPDNYRGITLLSCLGKLFTASLNARLSNYVEGMGIIGGEQAGFREGYSTLDHVFSLQSIIELYLREKKRVYCAFVDYRKAFDMINRSFLWNKLLGSGVDGKVMKVIFNMYQNAKSSVRVGGKRSDTFSCNIGVRQGDNLSPLLFAIYLNDFEQYVKRYYSGLEYMASEVSRHNSNDDVEVFLKLYVLLYADDTIILAENAGELQKALHAVYNYCSTWDLTVNTSKTKVVIFSRGKVTNNPVFEFGNDNLEIVEDYVYLGVTFNYNGLFHKAIQKQISQARRAMFSLASKAYKLSLPLDMHCELFDKLVVPVLLYGCEIWGYQKLDSVEMFHKKFIKNLLRVKPRTANCMAYGELGRNPISVVVYQRMLNFWIKLAQSEDHKFSKTIYTLMKHLHDKDVYHAKWISKVKYVLDSSGFGTVWRDQNTIKVEWFKKALNLRLLDMNRQTWASEVTTNVLCTNYTKFKEDLQFEKYILQLEIPDRISLTKFRCGNHNLPISDRRYLGAFVADGLKYCEMCNSGEIGDEYHYILKCPSIKAMREKYIDRYYYNRPTDAKFFLLFNSKVCTVQLKLVKFVKYITNLFS